MDEWSRPIIIEEVVDEDKKVGDATTASSLRSIHIEIVERLRSAHFTADRSKDLVLLPDSDS